MAVGLATPWTVLGWGSLPLRDPWARGPKHRVHPRLSHEVNQADALVMAKMQVSLNEVNVKGVEGLEKQLLVERLLCPRLWSWFPALRLGLPL